MTGRGRRVLGGLFVLGLIGLLAAFSAAPDGVIVKRSRTPRKKPGPVLFLHSQHPFTTCYRCHPVPFTWPRPDITHREMKRGAYCGACHDGKQAVEIKKLDCRSCHVR